MHAGVCVCVCVVRAPYANSTVIPVGEDTLQDDWVPLVRPTS